MSAGHIQRRGKSSWRLKFEGERDPETGQRNIQYVTVRGTKAAAKAKLVELVAAVGNGSYVEPSRVAVSEHVRARIAQWEAAGDVSARTAERYRELLDHQIAPTSAPSRCRSSQPSTSSNGIRRERTTARPRMR